MKSFSRLILLIAAIVSLVLLLVSYFFFTGFSNHQLKTSAVKQADTVAQLTFATMYQLMSKGWTRADVVAFADHSAASLKKTRTRVTFYRAEPVSRQFGEVSGQTLTNELDFALKSGRTREVLRESGLTYHMPLIAEQDCLRCHTQARRGDVLGAITVDTELGQDMDESNKHMFLILLLLAPLPFIAALVVAIQLDRRFEDFNAGLEAAGADAVAGRPVNLNRVPVRYSEFEETLGRIRSLLNKP